jgi:phospholipid/cholesterol/gamma-HCH transport system substrate-binding protein
VLQGESGTVEQLLAQTTDLTTFLASRDQVYGEVLTNLVPVLQNLAGQGDLVSTTIVELKELMVALAKDRRTIGESVDAVGQLVGDTSQFLDEVDDPLVRALSEFRGVARLNAETRDDLARAIRSFSGSVETLGRIASYENAVNVYPCTLRLELGNAEVNPFGEAGPWSEVCS